MRSCHPVCSGHLEPAGSRQGHHPRLGSGLLVSARRGAAGCCRVSPSFPPSAPSTTSNRRCRNSSFRQFLPTSQDESSLYFNQFADGASKLGLIGFLFLVLASILLLDNIESNFNQIWHVTTQRKFISKITSYTSVLVFGTLLLGTSITMSARIKAAAFPRYTLRSGDAREVRNLGLSAVLHLSRLSGSCTW